MRFCVANSVFSALAFLESPVNAKLRTLEVFNTQNQNLGWPQTAYGEDPQDGVFARSGVRQQSAEFLYGQKPFTGFLAHLGHDEFARRTLRNEIFVDCILKASLHIRADLTDCRFAEPIFVVCSGAIAAASTSFLAFSDLRSEE
jgi:hypothetical protein